MDIMEAMLARHSVRAYKEQRIEQATVQALQKEIDVCNAESGLRIQLATEEPGAFGGLKAKFGSFRNVRNYIALVGEKSEALNVLAGYYGERIALCAQQLGLNTCWVAATFSKSKCRCAMEAAEKLVCVLATGYGETQGTPHKSKPLEALTDVANMPEWFRRGLEAAALAPTAMNQQKFRFSLRDGKVIPQTTGGAYSKIDLGIAKYHFEVGAGRDAFAWA